MKDDKTVATVEEYFEWEFSSQERYEYADGEIRLLAGGTPNHNFVVGNLLVVLKSLLKNQYYDVFVLAQRLWLRDRNIYTYPDIMVLKQPIELQEGRTDTVMNPCLIAEVLSTSTKDYDRSEKFLAYRTVAAFREYLLIDQYQIHVEHYVKTAANQWLLSEYKDPEVTLNLSSVNLQLKIADLYENIEFTAA
ncbi:MAG: Uma2 family endonuclease [Cyanobacteria bacterium P01_G01_bin.19]